MTDDSGRGKPASAVLLATSSQRDLRAGTSARTGRFTTPCGQVPNAEDDGDRVLGERLTFGDIIADRVTKGIGSWQFILVYFALLTLWIVVNTVAWMRHWDPYPFIFLNLVLSFQGAFAAPIILMSQNRQEKSDRFAEARDHAVNLQAEQAVEAIQEQIEEMGRALMAEITTLHDAHDDVLARIDTLAAPLERDQSTKTA